MVYRIAKIDTGLLAGVVVGAAIILAVSSILLFDFAGKQGGGLSPEYRYDISAYTKIAPEWILYKQAGPVISTNLKQSHSIALRNSIYVTGDTGVIKISPNGTVEQTFDLGAMPTCIAVDTEGTIYAGIQNAVVITEANGAKRTHFQVPHQNAVLTSIALDNDHIFIADAANGLIYRYDKNNNLVNTIGDRNPDAEDHKGFIIPSPYFDLLMASDGLLRVVDPGRHLIIAFTVDGHREWSWGLASPKVEGFSGCCNPVNFAILPDGQFVTVEKGLVRVKLYDSEGKFVGVVAGPEQLELRDPQRVCDTPEQCQTKGFDVAVDADGKIYILDTVKNVVRMFEKK